MKAAVLYSGGKDSSFVAVMLERLGLDVELYTANFGVYDSYVPAPDILKKTCEKILEDGFPNDGIKYIHRMTVEELARTHDIIADGTRRDDRTPKLSVNQIKSLEDRFDAQYINLDSFGHKSVKMITESLFEISKERSNRDTSSDFEVEIREMIEDMGSNPLDIFPQHYQTRVIGPIWAYAKTNRKLRYRPKPRHWRRNSLKL